MKKGAVMFRKAADAGSVAAAGIRAMEKGKALCYQGFFTKTMSIGARIMLLKELQEILGLSRASIYELLKRREFRWIVVGGKYIISKPGFDEWFDGSTASGEAHAKLRFLKGDQDLGYKVIFEYSWAKSGEMGARLRRTAKIPGFKRLTLSTSTGCRK